MRKLGMRRFIAVTVVGIVCLGGGSSSATPMPLQVEASRRARVTALAVNVRDAASRQGRVVFQARRGEEFRALDTVDDWVRVENASGQTGFIHRSLVELIEVTPAPSPAETAASAPVAVDSRRIEIGHDRVSCLMAEQYPKIDACITPGESVGRAQIHFRANDADPWYAVDMKPAGACLSAYLPKPQRSTKQVQYYLYVVDREFNERSEPDQGPRAPFRAQVVRRQRDCAGMNPAMGSAAASVIAYLVLNASGEAAAVSSTIAGAGIAGFSMQGVVVGAATAAAAGAAAATGAATATGTAVGAGATTSASAGGLSTTQMVMIGAGAATVAGVGLALAGGGNDAPIDAGGQPCNQETMSGGLGVTTTVHQLGTRRGAFVFEWDAFSVPDRFEVYYENNRIFDTGVVSGGGQQSITFGGSSTKVTVTVTGGEGYTYTYWKYTVHCPN